MEVPTIGQVDILKAMEDVGAAVNSEPYVDVVVQEPMESRNIDDYPAFAVERNN